MVISGKICSECKREMLLDHVHEKDGVKTFYYACINPKCRERGKAYSATGTETTSLIKDKE